MEALINFLDQLKNGEDVNIPVYSHEIYDIVPGEKQRVAAANFVIVEGINVSKTLKMSVFISLISLIFQSMWMLLSKISKAGTWIVSLNYLVWPKTTLIVTIIVSLNYP